MRTVNTVLFDAHLQGTSANNPIKLMSSETRLPVLHFYRFDVTEKPLIYGNNYALVCKSLEYSDQKKRKSPF